MIAVSSKNDEDTARLPFRQHPDMLLRESHIAVFQANWIDKPSNLQAIANTLNIGVDALVLLDDNPSERAQVRQSLPMVAIPELPRDVAWYPWYLSAAGYFEAVGFSAEDKLRNKSYAAEAQRAKVMVTAGTLSDYLTLLEMNISFAPFEPAGRPRIVQLINKTNQFNLTTKRYTEAAVAALEGDADAFTLQVRLRDRFGELGMIAVAICRPDSATAATWELDTWLMSCRVLGRRVEEAMLAEIADAARQRSIRCLVGVYRPTAKNQMVKDHYRKLGFEPISEEPDHEHRFRLEVSRFIACNLPFAIERKYSTNDNMD
jgi:FkbH-like protein